MEEFQVLSGKLKIENGECERSEPVPYTQFTELDVGQAIHEVCDGENFGKILEKKDGYEI